VAALRVSSHSNQGLNYLPGGIPIVDQDGIWIGAIASVAVRWKTIIKVAKAGVDVIAYPICRPIRGRT